MTTINLDYHTGAAYYGDCADIMTAWKKQGVQGIIDLIYLDPPFNSNRNYGAPTARAKDSDTGSMDAFTDMWTYDQPAYERTERICKTIAHPAGELISGLRSYLEKRDDGMLAYLTYMADRLWILHGLLKETGSIYLHCDPSANYYLRLLMDSVFGPKNFRNEIVWCYTGPSNTKRWFPRKHDTILCYGKTRRTPKSQAIETKFNPEAIRISYSEDSVKRFAKQYNEGKGSSVIFRAGHDLKRIQDKFSEGKMPEDWWSDISPVGRIKGEYLGFPTQKPLKLLDRIIQASSNEGDVVLDPFCGCGTALHSAFNNKRQFIGIDISVFSVHSVTRKRMKNKCGLDVPIYGIPTNIAGAKLLAKQDWESFEAWAAESLNFGDIGILSNKIKRCDGGIDGKGKLYGKTSDGEDEVIVQVKGGAPSIDQVKAFANIIQSNPRVAAGIFITMDQKDWTAGMEKWAQSLGTFTMPEGTRSFRRLQHWPVSNRFIGEDGVYPKMPIMVNPLNGKPLVNIGHTF